MKGIRKTVSLKMKRSHRNLGEKDLLLDSAEFVIRFLIGKVDVDLASLILILNLPH